MRAAILALTLSLAIAAPAAAVAPGTVDFSVREDFGTLSGSFGHEAVFAPDGRIVAVGNAAQGFASRIGVTRRMYSGIRDPSFGNGGFVRVTASDPAWDATGDDVIRLADGRVLVSGLYSSEDGTARGIIVVRLEADGDLDPTFSGDGRVEVPLPGVANEVPMGRDSQGRIVVAAERSRPANPSITDFAVLRLTAAGELDGGFGGTGLVVDPVGDGAADPTGLVMQPDDRVVVSGTARTGGRAVFAARRYTTAGAPDATFGAGGTATVAMGTGDAEANSLARQPATGRLIVAGAADTASGKREFAFAALTAGGALDTTFGSGGRGFVGHQADDGHGAVDVEVDGSGRIVAAGVGLTVTVFPWALARLTANGVPDGSFGTGGLITGEPFPSGGETALAVAVQPDGRIVALGTTRGINALNFTLRRYFADGDGGDLDHDGVPDTTDTCDLLDAPQTDTDGDGQGDACDADDRTQLVTRATGTKGTPATSAFGPKGFSADGRYVLFTGRLGGVEGAYLRDRQLRTTELVNLLPNGNAPQNVFNAALSGDGGSVLFPAGSGDLYVRDLEAGSTAQVTLPAGVDAFGGWISISHDGSRVAFDGSAGGSSHIYVAEAGGQAVAVDRASGAAGALGNRDAYSGSISADGRYVAFVTDASNLAPVDTDSAYDVFLRDLETDTTTLVTDGPGRGAIGNGFPPSVNGPGPRVAFESPDGFVAGDGDGLSDIYVRDLATGAFTLVSDGGPSPGEATDDEATGGVLSADGKHVAYQVNTDWPARRDDVYVAHVETGAIELVTRARGSGGAAPSPGGFGPLQISSQGRWVSFYSTSDQLAAGETSDGGFVRDVLGGPAFPLPPDGDGDGTFDVDDACPSAAGTAADGCPDGDGDGVSDQHDACPAQAGTLPNGCPAPPADSDGDGVPDATDQCPGQFGPRPSGCPSAPVADADGDGLLPPYDACPFATGPASTAGCPPGGTAGLPPPGGSTGAGTAGGAGLPAPFAVALRASLLTVRADRRGRFLLSIGRHPARVSGIVVLRAGRTRISRPVSAAAGRVARVRVTLPPALRAKLRRTGRLTLTAVITLRRLTDGAVATRDVRLRVRPSRGT